MTTLRGRLLVATPPLTDPNFDRTVVLMLEHGEDGALGLVLNRPSRTALDAALPEWDERAADPAVVFVGGPVAPDAVIALARSSDVQVHEPDSVAGWVGVAGALGTVDVGLDPKEIGVHVDAMRVFAGYAGWEPGQLESELEVGGWFVVDLVIDDVFTSEPATLWRTVLRRQRGRLAMFAHCPADPAVN